MFKRDKFRSAQGFTLVEVLIVILIIAVLTIIILVALNPLSQLDKARDAQRKYDFKQIQSALDSYYNDTGCYPTQEQGIPFGGQWKSSNSTSVYMQKVPQDPDCVKTGYCYVYQTDATSDCPQWNILWTRLSRPTSSIASCLIRSTCGVYPNMRYNYCLLSGKVDCDYISSHSLPITSITPTPTPTTAPVTPTPSGGGGQGGCRCADAHYDVRAGNCNSVNSPPFTYCDSNCQVPCY